MEINFYIDRTFNIHVSLWNRMPFPIIFGNILNIQTKKNIQTENIFKLHFKLNIFFF